MALLRCCVGRIFLLGILAQSHHPSPRHPLDLNSMPSRFHLNTIASRRRQGGRIVVTVVLVVDGLYVSLIGVEAGVGWSVFYVVSSLPTPVLVSARPDHTWLGRYQWREGLAKERSTKTSHDKCRSSFHLLFIEFIPPLSNRYFRCRIDIAGVEPISPLSNRYSRCPIDSCHLRPFSPSQTSYPPCWTCVDRCGSLGNLLWSWRTSLQEGRRSCG